MKIVKTKFEGLLILKRPTYHDNRGFLKELFEQKNFKKKKFVFDYFSFSKKNVIRGLHLQYKKPQAKMISVLNGKIVEKILKLSENILLFIFLQKITPHYIYLRGLLMDFAV